MKHKLLTILFTASSLAFIWAIYAMMSDNSSPHSPKHNVTMKKLFLCSSFHDVASLLPKSFSVPLKGKTVAFIPTASIHEEYTQYVEEGKVALDSLGLVVNELKLHGTTRRKLHGACKTATISMFRVATHSSSCRNSERQGRTN